MNEIDKYPPFQKEKIRKDFENLLICWKLKLENVEPIKSNLKLGHVMGIEEQNKYHRLGVAFFNIDVEENPKFKFSHKGTKFTVKGKIEKVAENYINLKDCSVQIDETE